MRNTTAFAHDVECMCPKCLMADLDAHIIETRGQDALSRINLTSDNDRATVEPVKTRNLNAGQKVGRGYVRKISSKQVWLINKLIAERDTTNIVLLPGQTLIPEEIPNMGVKGGTALIDKLFMCDEKPKPIANDSVKKELNGSARQIEWITKGLNGKPSLLSEKGFTQEPDINKLFISHNYSAKSVIKSEVKQDEIMEGMYTDGKRIIRAYSNREKSRILAKELIQEDDDYSFSYLGMAERFVKGMRRMTLDEAKAFGRMTETCCVCGIHLSDPDSQKKGIGPWCEKQF
jgi:hypothetical protein